MVRIEDEVLVSKGDEMLVSKGDETLDSKGELHVFAEMSFLSKVW